jgi:hypothetical protein
MRARHIYIYIRKNIKMDQPAQKGGTPQSKI